MTERRIGRIARGFTLVELLVVLVIIAVIAGVVVMRVGNTSGNDQIEDTARRLRALMLLAAEEAVLQGQTIGLRLEREQYLFTRYDQFERKWSTLGDDEIFSARELDEGIDVELIVESLEVELPLADESVDSDEFGAAPPVPQLVFFSSGEMTPFEMIVSSDNSELEVRLVGGPLGAIDVPEREQ